MLKGYPISGTKVRFLTDGVRTMPLIPAGEIGVLISAPNGQTSEHANDEFVVRYGRQRSFVAGQKSPQRKN